MKDVALSGKKVLVVGLGRSGAAAAVLAAAQGAHVTVTDRRPAAALTLAASLPARIGKELGGHNADTFAAADLIVLSPGVPPLPEVAYAQAASVRVTGELEFAANFISAPLIAITGTNGKSTTTTLCGAMMAATGRSTFVGGNLGVPLSEAVGTTAAGADGVCVVEVSSFQLDTTTRFKPKVAVLLNITPDHLDRYEGMDGYAASKARIFANSSADDFAVVNIDDPRVEAIARTVHSRVIPLSTRQPLREGGWINGDVLCVRLPGGPEENYPAKLPGLVGLHNLENALAAALAARLLGATPAAVLSVLTSFAPLHHRMALVAETNGVAFFDDSKGTNVGAVVAALSGFPRPVVLIAGGRDKGGAYEPLAVVMKQVGRAAVVIGESAARIETVLGQVVPVQRAASLEEAVVQAAALAHRGDAVVLSPACSSFDMFRDYEHRGQIFCAAVHKLAQAEGVADTAAGGVLS